MMTQIIRFVEIPDAAGHCKFEQVSNDIPRFLSFCGSCGQKPPHSKPCGICTKRSGENVWNMLMCLRCGEIVSYNTLKGSTSPHKPQSPNHGSSGQRIQRCPARVDIEVTNSLSQLHWLESGREYYFYKKVPFVDYGSVKTLEEHDLDWLIRRCRDRYGIQFVIQMGSTQSPAPIIEMPQASDTDWDTILRDFLNNTDAISQNVDLPYDLTDNTSQDQWHEQSLTDEGSLHSLRRTRDDFENEEDDFIREMEELLRKYSPNLSKRQRFEHEFALSECEIRLTIVPRVTPQRGLFRRVRVLPLSDALQKLHQTMSLPVNGVNLLQCIDPEKDVFMRGSKITLDLRDHAQALKLDHNHSEMVTVSFHLSLVKFHFAEGSVMSEEEIIQLDGNSELRAYKVYSGSMLKLPEIDTVPGSIFVAAVHIARHDDGWTLRDEESVEDFIPPAFTKYYAVADSEQLANNLRKYIHKSVKTKFSSALFSWGTWKFALGIAGAGALMFNLIRR